jgi:hypothetical protein
MTIGDLVRSRPVPVLYGLMFISLIALLPLPPLLQNQDYHQFADQRELFGIPNFWNGSQICPSLRSVQPGCCGFIITQSPSCSLRGYS